MALVDEVQIRALYIRFDVAADPVAALAAMKAKLSHLMGMQERHVLSSNYMGSGVTYQQRGELDKDVAKYVIAIERLERGNPDAGFRSRTVHDGSGFRNPFRGMYR